MKIVKDNVSIEIKYCNTFLKRLKGFMFKKKIDYSLCFPNCNSIHTFFMLKKIDVVMTDKDYNILYIYENLKPFRIILPKKNVYYTFEFPTNYIDFKLNEKIDIK